MGDFTGFTFGDKHSYDDLGITRVSDGSRYNEELFPEIKDLTAEVPGLNGEYYFGSNYGTRSFTIDFAFDSLTEEQFRQLRTVFGTKETRKLIFDERPYKYYLAKIESPIELSFVCFDEPYYEWQKLQIAQNTYAQGISGDFERKIYDGTKRRIYKGEGSVTFICYFPFAKSNYKILPVEEVESDWVLSSGILSSQTYVNENIDQWVNNRIKLYNPGDLEVGFRLYLPANVVTTNNITLIYEADSIHQTASLVLNQMILEADDVGVLIDTNNGLITGVSSAPVLQNNNYTYTTSGNLYNRYVNAGYFFKIEPTGYNITSILQINNGNSNIKIFYDYLYF